MKPNVKRRSGVTLTEVLIAIFVMGIGLMAILSLFPLGASQMAQAIKDQRAAEAAANASALARIMWKQACDEDLNIGLSKFYDSDPGPTLGMPQSRQRWVMALDDPSYNMLPTATPQKQNDYGIPPSDGSAGIGAPIPDAGSNSPPMPPIPKNRPRPNGQAYPSYPVFVDPIGFAANAANNARRWWLPSVPVSTTGGNVYWRIPRRSVYYPKSAPTGTFVYGSNWVLIQSLGFQPILKQFSLLDDMTFEVNGQPKTVGNSGTGAIERAGKYSWAYMFRRSANSFRDKVDYSVVVYGGGHTIDVASPENAFLGTGQINSRTLTVTYGPVKPNIRRGGWILDASLCDDTGGLAPQGYFYRVVNVDDSVPGQLLLDLQTSLIDGPQGNNRRVIVVMDNVIEVFPPAEVAQTSPPTPH